MAEPLRLRKPKAVKNWFRSGRWHKVYARPGRTEFRSGDLCQFKPDLLDVEVEDVLRTPERGTHLYRVRALSSGHRFSTYGNDLLLLIRHKPVLEMRVKPKLVIPKKSRQMRVKPQLVLLHRPPAKRRFVRPEKGVVGRLSYWCDWGPFPNQWCYTDFTSEAELQAAFWQHVEERAPRRSKYYHREHYLDGVYTVRFNRPELVCVEWFPPYYQPQQENESDQQQKRKSTALPSMPEKAQARTSPLPGGRRTGRVRVLQRMRVLPRVRGRVQGKYLKSQQENENAGRKRAVPSTKAVLRGGRKDNGGGTATKDQAKGKAKQPVHPRKSTQPKGHRKGQKARVVYRATQRKPGRRHLAR